MMHRFLIIAIINNISQKKKNNTLKKSYIPFNEIKQGLQNNFFHFNCNTLQQMYHSKEVFFSFSFWCVSLFYSIKPHMLCFYMKKQPTENLVINQEQMQQTIETADRNSISIRNRNNSFCIRRGEVFIIITIYFYKLL